MMTTFDVDVAFTAWVTHFIISPSSQVSSQGWFCDFDLVSFMCIQYYVVKGKRHNNYWEDLNAARIKFTKQLKSLSLSLLLHMIYLWLHKIFTKPNKMFFFYLLRTRNSDILSHCSSQLTFSSTWWWWWETQTRAWTI
jgi:hypothetical protein